MSDDVKNQPATPTSEPTQPVKRKRGRPRKNPLPVPPPEN